MEVLGTPSVLLPLAKVRSVSISVVEFLILSTRFALLVSAFVLVSFKVLKLLVYEVFFPSAMPYKAPAPVLFVSRVGVTALSTVYRSSHFFGVAVSPRAVLTSFQYYLSYQASIQAVCKVAEAPIASLIAFYFTPSAVPSDDFRPSSQAAFTAFYNTK